MSEYIGPKKPPQLAIDAGVMSIAAPAAPDVVLPNLDAVAGAAMAALELQKRNAAAPGDADEALIAKLRELQPGFDGCVAGHRLAQEAANAITRLRETLALSETIGGQSITAKAVAEMALADACDGAALTEGRLKARIADLEGALGELIEIRRIADRMEASDTKPTEWEKLSLEYQRRAPLAWANARQLIKGKRDEQA